MLRALINRIGRPQWLVAANTLIPKNRMTRIVNDESEARPDEIVALDKELHQNKRLVYRFCSTICPAGRYAGYQFVDGDDAKAAGIQIISTLTVLDRLIPDLADMICKGELVPELMCKLKQLRVNIMTLEVQLDHSSCSPDDVECIRRYVKQRKNRQRGHVSGSSVKL